MTMAGTYRRSRSRQASKGQGRPLFQGATGQRADGPPVVVLSSNFSIGPLLARGALLPEALEGDAVSKPALAGGLRWSLGGIPAEWVTALAESARNVIPIAIRLWSGRGVRRLAVAGHDGTIDGICASDVEGVFFRTERERVRFESLEFSNYDLDAVDIGVGVEASLFEAAGGDGNAATDLPQGVSARDSGADGRVRLTGLGSSGDVIRAVRSAECAAGLLAFLLTASPGTRPWMRGVQRVFAKKVTGPATSWPERVASAAVGGVVEASSGERALLGALVDVMRRYPVESGWPAEEVLAEVAAAAKGRIEPEDERAVGDLDRWAARAADVLASRAEPQSLADDGFVLQRAALLLLLRADLEALAGGAAEGSGAQRPGPSVRGTARALAALRTGLRALPVRHKRGADAGRPGHWLAYLGEVFVALLQTGKPTALVPAGLAVPAVKYRSIRPLRGEWIVSIASREVARTAVEVDHGLERLLAMGQHLGFEVQEHGDNGLRASVSLGDARTRPVYLELIRTEHGSRPMVRFSSSALKVMGVGSRRRIARDVALDLLRRNAGPAMNCRFAINRDATEVLVLVDQLLATLDDLEFMEHIRQVAKAAEDFESSRVETGVGERGVR